MKFTSIAFSLAVFTAFAAMTAFVWWGAKKHSNWGEAKRRRVCLSFLIGGLAFSLFAYWTDSRQRAVTLFEVRINWEGSSGKEWRIEVEHPGTPHKLYLQPLLPPLGKAATAPVILRVGFAPEGGSPVLAEELEFGLESSGNRTRRRMAWESHVLTFLPGRAGTHQLRIEAPSGPPPRLFIRIEDPLKRDGRRARGY